MNKTTIIGNLTKDPESRTTQDGKNVCNFTVAVNRRQRDQNGNTIADFFRVSAWSKLGENCQKYLAKGRKVGVVGAVSAHPYTDNQGNARANLELFAEEVEFLSPIGQQGQATTEAPSSAQAPAQGGFQQVESDELPF